MDIFLFAKLWNGEKKAADLTHCEAVEAVDQLEGQLLLFTNDIVSVPEFNRPQMRKLGMMYFCAAGALATCGHPDVQERVRQVVRDNKTGFEKIMGPPFPWDQAAKNEQP